MANIGNKNTTPIKPQLFEGVDRRLIEELLNHCESLALKPGDVLLSPDRDNSSLYYLIEGKLSVRVGSASSTILDTFRAGDCAGEISYLDGMRPSAFVVADAASRVLKIDADTLTGLIEYSHRVSINLVRILTSRVRSGLLIIGDTFEHLHEHEKHANIDALTGLHNRRWFNEMFHREHERVQRDGTPACALMIDIDYFKQYNDNNGHLAGDRALCAVANCLSDSLRPADMIARYGGEEFTIFLPETTKDEGLAIAQRTCDAIAATQISFGGLRKLPSVTISVGMAAVKRNSTLDELMLDADAALYRAKEAGRNCVHI